MKIAINGFGRIGKTFLRSILNENIDIVAINIGPCNSKHIDLLFKHDSIMGTLQSSVNYKDNYLHIDDKKILVISEPNPQKIDWSKLDIDWVVESSGCFTDKKSASMHIQSGAKKVLITAPCEDADITIVPGINENQYNPNTHNIISIGSCTTNCIIPIIKVLNDSFSIQNGMMTTIHSYTNDQVLLDVEHKDPRRARAAATNIIPTKTGAQKLINKIFPMLDGKIFASAIRVPTPNVSIVVFVFTASQNITKENINSSFQKASKNELKSILSYTEMPLVSGDYMGSPYSCILDAQLTQASDNMGKVFGWYDNEWGYSQRLKDFLLHNS